MKRILSLILVVLILSGLFVMPASAETAEDDGIVKILLIGGSFGRDTADDMGYILKGYKEENFLMGRLAKANTTLKDHYTYCAGGSEVYTYYETHYNQPTADYDQNKVSGIKTAAAAAERHEWDYVILHTTAIDCGLPSKFVDEEGNSYVDLFVKFMKTIEPNAKYVWNTTWQPPETTVNGKTPLSGLRENFDGDSLKMYKAVTDCARQYAEPYVDMVIPANTAIQNLEGLGMPESTIYRDQTHLNTTYGCYAVGILTLSKLLGVTPEELSSAYRNENISDENLEIILNAVKYALADPYVSYTTAESIINELIFSYRPSFFEGKSEAEAKTMLKNVINPAVLYTGAVIDEEDIAISDYKTDANFTFSCKLSESFAVSDKNVVISPSFTVTPSVKSGSSIPVIGKLDFTFDMVMKEETLTTQNILLKESVKSPGEGEDTFYPRNYTGEYNAETKTYTITFDEGDIPSGVDFTVEFTTNILSEDDVALEAPVAFTYTTEWGEYYINENFSRYSVGDSLTQNKTTKKILLPYQYSGQTYGGSSTTPRIKNDTDGVQAMWAKGYHESRDGSGYLWGIRRDYLPMARTFFTEIETEFLFTGDEGSAYAIGNTMFLIREAANGKHYLCYSKPGNGAPGSATALATAEAIPLTEVKENVKTTVKYVVYRDKNSSEVRNRYLYKLYYAEGEQELAEVTSIIDTAETGISFVTDITADTVIKTKDFTSPVQLANAKNYYFDSKEATSTTTGFSNFGVVATKATLSAELWIYSFKYKAYDAIKTTSPINEAKNVPLSADAVLTFDTDMDEDSLENIKVEWVDMLSEVTYQGTYDKTNKTYTLDFDETPAHRVTYRLIFPSTLKTASGHDVEVTEDLSFVFEDRITKFEEGAGSVTGNTFAKTVNLTNPNPGAVVLAVYSGGKFLGVDVSEITTAEDKLKEIPLSVTEDTIADTSKTIEYKIMYFKNLQTITPYFEKITGNVNR